MQMKEKIFTIPVNDAFDSGCECPVCYMKRELEMQRLNIPIKFQLYGG